MTTIEIQEALALAADLAREAQAKGDTARAEYLAQRIVELTLAL